MSKIRIAINGAAGRMGQRLIALAKESPDLEVVCGVEPAGHPAVNTKVDNILISDHLAGNPQAVIDFSHPLGTMNILPQTVKAGVALVIGTTGISAEQQNLVNHAAREIPIVQSANMSLGVNVLLKLVAEAAKAFGEAYDIEIVEAHHRFKKDAPSGTALALARSICEAVGKDMAASLVHGRSGESPRQAGQIGMHAVRLGDTVGEHSVMFGSLGETITLSHSAHTRDIFARGALRAAAWAAGKKPGKYSMLDVLFGEK